MNPKRFICKGMTCLLLLGAGSVIAQDKVNRSEEKLQQERPVGMDSAAAEPAVVIDFTREHQCIAGFGVGEADWADDVFVFPRREEVLDALFGGDGLRINILRGEIFPHYSADAQHRDFATQADTCLQVARNAATLEKNDLLRRGQFWLTSHVQQKYPDILFTFSAWSPPAWMKEGGYATPDYPASHGKLKREHYQTFADYLADFYQAYRRAGIETYAISPSNEPGYAAPWNSCLWSAEEMGQFINDYLLPTFERRAVKAKVQFGENPAWSTVFEKLKMISSADFVNEVLATYPQLDSSRVIAAGHGYVLPDTMPLPASLRRTPIIPFREAEKRGIPMWVTEISDITPLDTSMKDGLYWADQFHQYLMKAHVSGLVYWLGAQPTHTNESLIVLNRTTGDFIRTKRYDTFGNYTRYVPVGSRCVENRTEGLPEGACVSSFRHGRSFVVVVVNPTAQPLRCPLQLKGAAAARQALRSYTTTAHTRWEEGRVPYQKKRHTLEVPPESVVTFVGTLKGE